MRLRHLVLTALLLLGVTAALLGVRRWRQAPRPLPDAVHALPLEQLPRGMTVPMGERSIRAWRAEGLVYPFYVNASDEPWPLVPERFVDDVELEALGDDGWFRVNPIVVPQRTCGNIDYFELQPGRFMRGWGWSPPPGGEPARLRFRLDDRVSDAWEGSYDPGDQALVRIDDRSDEEGRVAALLELVEGPDPRLGEEGSIRSQALKLLLWSGSDLGRYSPHRRRIIEEVEHPLRGELLARMRHPARVELTVMMEAVVDGPDRDAREIVRLLRFGEPALVEELMLGAVADEPLGAAWVEALLLLERPGSFELFDARWARADEPVTIPVGNPTDEPVELAWRDPAELFRLGSDAWPKEVPAADQAEVKVTLTPGASHDVQLLPGRYFDFREARERLRVHLAVPGLPARHWDFRVEPVR